MAYGLGDQIERRLDYDIDSKRGVVQHSHKWDKVAKHRAERRRAKLDIECMPKYRRYKGWEW
jgi:hypothetical protein